MSEDLDIPEFLRMTPAQRKEVWEKDPPKFSSAASWRTPEQAAMERARLQRIADERRLARCQNKQKRLIQRATQETILEDRSHAKQGHTWDVRTARWINPIEEALQPAREEKTAMVKKATAPKKKKEDGKENVFGFRPDTNYSRMMNYLLAHKGQFVPVEALAKEAYGNGQNLQKHCNRVVTMARKVQERVIKPKQLPFNIVKERKENVISIGLFTK
jgi:hypothetical protein